jgi:protein-tyrosine phosphatase
VPPEKRVQILCVCTGNICRSPAAERLLASRLGSEVEVSSAGTYALVGQPISPPMDQLVQSAGAEAGGFVARRLTERIVQPADLVLALTRAHRGDVVELWPKAVRRAFTLKEFARLLAEVDRASLPSGGPGERLRAALPLVSARRRQVPDPRLDDVVDPYRQPAELYGQAFSDIEQAVSSIAAVLRP